MINGRLTPNHFMTMISTADIEAAYQNIQKDIVRTPLVFSPKLSRLCGCRVLLKLENFQLTGSFKERGPCSGPGSFVKTSAGSDELRIAP